MSLFLVLLGISCFFLSACDDVGKPEKLAEDAADVTGDVLEIIGTLTGNEAIKEFGKEIENQLENSHKGQ